MTDRTLTGRHVLAMFALGFGIVIVVNVTMAVNAIRTFPGLEVANSYVASQSFDDRRAAQEALGWVADVTYHSEKLSLSVKDRTGTPLDASDFAAVVGRPTMRADDQPLTFTATGETSVALAPGRWRMDLTSTAEDRPFSQTLHFWVSQ